MKLRDVLTERELATYNRRKERILLPPTLRRSLPSSGAFLAARHPDPVLHARLIAPNCSISWYVAAGDPDSGGISRYEDDYIFYGLVINSWTGPSGEWGGFSLREMDQYCVGFALGIERDVRFAVTTESVLVRELQSVSEDTFLRILATTSPAGVHRRR